MVRQVFGLVIWYLPLFFQIFLVADKDSRDIFLSMFVDLAHPLWDFGKRISVSDIIRDDDTMSTLVIWRSDSLKSLLSSSVPNLKLDSFSIYINCSDFEVDTDSWHEVIMENIILYYKFRLKNSYDIFSDKPGPQIPMSDSEKIWDDPR